MDDAPLHQKSDLIVAFKVGLLMPFKLLFNNIAICFSAPSKILEIQPYVNI